MCAWNTARCSANFGIIVAIVLDPAVWIMGAEVLYPRGIAITITSFNDLARFNGQPATEPRSGSKNKKA
jgi:hypothetical protein